MKFKLLFITLIFFSITLQAQWVKTNDSYDGSINALAISGENIFAGGERVFLSTDRGSSWSAIDNGLTDLFVLSIAIIGDKIFLGTQSSGVFLSTNNGSNWNQINNGLTNLSANTLAINGENIFVGTFDGMFLSTDNGANWSAINNGLTSLNVWSMSISGDNIFIGTFGGVFLSTDNGSNWTAVNDGLTEQYIWALSSNGDNIFAGTSGGIFLSTDNGSHWNTINNGLTNLEIASLAITEENIFACTDGKGEVFLSKDNGSTWNAINDSLTNAAIYSLAISENYVFAGTRNSIWRRPLTELITDVNENRNYFSTSFSLKQNYPNPFNPNTRIRYTLPEANYVSLKIYDLLGKEITILVDRTQSVGSYTYEFDGSNLSSGVYIYRLQAGEFTETKKLMLMK